MVHRRMHGAAHLCVRFYQSSCWQTLAALDISHHVNHIAAQQEVAEACRRAGKGTCMLGGQVVCCPSPGRGSGVAACLAALHHMHAAR